MTVTQELCQLVANELNSITKYAVRIYERSSETGNNQMRQYLADNITKTCQTLQSVVAHPTQSSPIQSTNINTSNDSNYSLPPESMTQAMTLLQQYSDKLINLVEQRISKQ